MSNSFWSSLPVRVGLTIAVGSVLLTALTSSIFYNQTYSNAVDEAEHNLRQLVATVESTATIAAFLDNREMALEVVEGLASNDLVNAVSLTTPTGMDVSQGTPGADPEMQSITFPLISPFMENDVVGKIMVDPNRQWIESQAREAAWIHVRTMVLQSSILVVLVIALIYLFLTRPLTQIIQKLHTIKPGDSRRIDKPGGHQASEIHILAHDINQLLSSVQETLEREILLRLEVESLERRFRMIFESASSGIAIIDNHGNLVSHNPSFEMLIGQENLKQLQESPDFTFPELFTDRQRVTEILAQMPLSLSPMALDIALRDNKDAKERWLHAIFSSVLHEREGFLTECIAYDISERTAREQRIQFEAEHDPLTGLLNRRAGMNHFNQAIQRSQTSHKTCAFMLIDLDRFKPINDSYGHEAGDVALIEIGRRLKEAVRSDDIVIRWGGDEFVAVVHQGQNPLQVETVAEKILHLLDDDITLQGELRVNIGASIGIAVIPDHGTTPNQLIQLADQAMYQVKQEGRNGYCIHGHAPHLLPDDDSK